ncbi:hypothetical protein CCP3SC5AM1_1750004 [Gammaproteobacteria bacterium]
MDPALTNLESRTEKIQEAISYYQGSLSSWKWIAGGSVFYWYFYFFNYCFSFYVINKEVDYYGCGTKSKPIKK